MAGKKTKRIKPHIPRLAWSPEEVAKALGVSAGFIRKEVWSGAIRSTRIGRRVIIADAELHRYLHYGSLSGEEASETLNASKETAGS